MDSTFVINCLETNNIDLLDIDPEAMCRMCTAAETKEFRGVFDSTGVLKNEKTGKPFQIYEVIQLMTRTAVRRDDGLPQNICRTCLKQLYTAYNFLTLAKKVDNAFRIFLGQTEESEIETEEVVAVEDEPAGEVSTSWQDANEDNTVVGAQIDIEMDQDEEEVQLLKEEEEQEEEIEYTNIHQLEEEDVEDTVVIHEQVVAEPPSPKKKKVSVAKKPATAEKKPRKSIHSSIVPHPTEGPIKKEENSQQQPEKGKPFECRACDKTYSFVQALNRHVRSHSNAGEKKKCPYCQRAFDRADTLTRHIRTHTNERPFSCEICDKKFKQTSELKDHLFSHTKDSTYTCQICFKVLTTRMGLYSHTKSFHKDAAVALASSSSGDVKGGQRRKRQSLGNDTEM